jgi:hypothetical protein
VSALTTLAPAGGDDGDVAHPDGGATSVSASC